MISHLTLENFKCFRKEALPMRLLTLLSGVNGAGKSSLLQALLLLRQAEDASSNETFVKLNGRYMLQLGQSADVLHHGLSDGQSDGQVDQRAIRLVLENDSGQSWDWRFENDDPESLVLNFKKTPVSPMPELAIGYHVYLSAERLGPRLSLPMNSLPSQALHVGVQGEFTAQVMEHKSTGKNSEVRAELLHPETKDGLTAFVKQVEFWMRDLIPDINIKANRDPATNTTSLSLRKDGVFAEWLRPTNMGFGVSYSLPIIVAGLLAPAGTLFLVENPEAHLHPAGQSHMGRFLATLAAAGVQVIAETHSDHLLNGVRLAVVRETHPIKANQVVIHHFHGTADAPQRTVQIEVDRRGVLSNSPTGFFDQSEQDLKAILHARSKPALTQAKLLKRHAQTKEGPSGT